MKRGIIVGLGLLAIVVGVGLWRHHLPSAPGPLAVRFPAVNEIRVSNLGGARELRLFQQKKLVARLPVFQRDSVSVMFNWKPDQAYRLQTDTGQKITIRAPAAPPTYVLRLHAPFGQTMHEVKISAPPAAEHRLPLGLAAAPSEILDLAVEVEQVRDAPPVTVRVKMVTPAESGMRLESSPVNAPQIQPLRMEFDKALFFYRLHLGAKLPQPPLLIRVEIGAGVWSFPLHFSGRNLHAADIKLVRWDLPVDADGHAQSQQLTNELHLPDPFWSRLAIRFGLHPRTVDYFTPYAFQVLRLRNRSSQPVSLLLRSTVHVPGQKQPLRFFAMPVAEGGTEQAKEIEPVIAFCRLPPGEVRSCVLPVYLRPDTPAGTFEREVQAVLLGSSQPLKTWTAPLGVTRSRPLLSIWVAAVIGVSLIWLALVLIFYRRLVRAFGLRLLVLLSLLGSLQFCLQFAGGLVSGVLYAVLGPFNCLVGGLLTEVMTYLLITSILFLAPRVGAMTLAGLVTYLMGAVMFGSFGFVDLLFVGSALAFRELFLFLFGVTHFSATRNPPRWGRMMLSLGLADAVSTFTSLALFAVFYRLFYANWYIGMQVLVTGFLYTVIGVFLGRSLGTSLRKVHP